jgi:hypothetical protein
MTKEMGEFVGQLIGELVDMDVGVTCECFGKYMRLRVMIDVAKSLKRFLRLELKKGEETTLLWRYEKLPEYCFQYGIIRHSYLKCHYGKEDGRRDVVSDFDFGPWLRASSPSGQHKSNGHYRFQGENSSTMGGNRKILPSVSLNPNRANYHWRARPGGSGENNLGSLNGRSVSRNDD